MVAFLNSGGLAVGKSDKSNLHCQNPSSVHLLQKDATFLNSVLFLFCPTIRPGIKYLSFIGLQGDVPGPDGHSPFPGNTNLFVASLASYVAALEQTKV